MNFTKIGKQKLGENIKSKGGKNGKRYWKNK